MMFGPFVTVRHSDNFIIVSTIFIIVLLGVAGLVVILTYNGMPVDFFPV